MAEHDLLLRRGTVVLTDTTLTADIAVTDGVITAIGPELPGRAGEEQDVTGFHIFPGFIDAHVHFNEPGRTAWEGIATGSRAVAAGGGTLFFDMPLNSTPPVLDATAFAAKAAAMAAQSLTDFALWGGLTPDNLERLDELADAGVIGYKAFFSGSGIDDFRRAGPETLRAGMRTAAARGLPVAVHAESEEITAALTTAARARGATGIRDWLDTRPVAAETVAIQILCDLAGETGCDLHIVHVSSAAGLAILHWARERGIRVTAETCPHYFTLTEDDVLALGAVAKCAPPLRPAAEREALVAALLAGDVDTIGSDHSPAPPELKTSPDFFQVWGGISGAQHCGVLTLDLFARQPQPDWPQAARLLSSQAARRFRLPRGTGVLAPGHPADLTVIDLRQPVTLTDDALHYRHPQSPYAGRTVHAAVRSTRLRGLEIARDGRALETPRRGRLIRPAD